LLPFDYIIVGAGSAGCVLANRLSADPAVRVLLLEAGPRDTDPWIHIPLGYGKLFNKRTVNWAYESEPEPTLNGRRMFSPRGKVRGGSSSINGLVYIRGQPEDYDGWEVPGWSYTELLPYFKKCQNQQRGASDHHGAGGPIGVSDMESHELADAFIDSAASIGIPRNRDFNGESQEGTGYYQCTTLNGRRSSTAVGYLREAEKRPNLTVLTEVLASRILFSGKKAVGVEYLKNKELQKAEAKKEILLCGGAFNSPQLLQLSGVGPRALLESHGIALVHEAPEVGEGLQDHFYGRTFWRCNRPITLNDDMASLFRQAKIGLQWFFRRRGPLTIAAGYAAAFVRTRAGLKRPDAQIYFINFSTAKRGGILHPFSGFTLSVSQLQVESEARCASARASPPSLRRSATTISPPRTTGAS
jgi:choline dehydrogenase